MRPFYIKETAKVLLGIIIGTSIPSLMAWGFVRLNDGFGKGDVFPFIILSFVFSIVTHLGGVISRPLNLGNEGKVPFLLLNSFLKGLIVSVFYICGVYLYMGPFIYAFSFPLGFIYLFSSSVHHFFILKAYSPKTKNNYKKIISSFLSLVVSPLVIPLALFSGYHIMYLAFLRNTTTYEYLIKEGDLGQYGLIWGRERPTAFHTYKIKEIKGSNPFASEFRHSIELKRSGVHEFQEKRLHPVEGEDTFYILRNGAKIKLDVYKSAMDGVAQSKRDIFIWEIKEGSMSGITKIMYYAPLYKYKAFRVCSKKIQNCEKSLKSDKKTEDWWNNWRPDEL